MPEWLITFPELNRETLRAMRRSLDEGYRGFS